MASLIAVGLSEIKVSSNPDDILVAYSLGSCVGVALWDPVKKAGGMVHAVLPGAGAEPGSLQAEAAQDPANPGKFAISGVPSLARKLEEMGCDLFRVKAWMAGGAHVLRGIVWPGGDIGAANTRVALEALRRLAIPSPLMDVGQDYGRTMRLYISSGKATVSSVGRGERDI